MYSPESVAHRVGESPSLESVPSHLNCMTLLHRWWLLKFAPRLSDASATTSRGAQGSLSSCAAMLWFLTSLSPLLHHRVVVPRVAGPWVGREGCQEEGCGGKPEGNPAAVGRGSPRVPPANGPLARCPLPCLLVLLVLPSQTASRREAAQAGGATGAAKAAQRPHAAWCTRRACLVGSPA